MYLDLLSWAAILVGSVAAQNCDVDPSACSTSTTTSGASSTASISTSTTTTVTSASSTSSAPVTAITVTSGGSVASAVSAAQKAAVPTVIIQPGTYTEQVIVPGNQPLTIMGPTATTVAENAVVIQATLPSAGVVTFANLNPKSVVFRNLNITNLGGSSSTRAPAVSMYGSNMAFYECALVSAGAGVYTANLGTAVIANSYIEGPDKLFNNYVTAYVYNSIIVPTISSASIFYSQGYQTGGVWYNSTLVVDSSTITTKPGVTISNVYLASPNGNYTQAVFRGTNIGSLVATAALRPTNCNFITLYGEFQNTGAGAMTAANTDARAKVCDLALSSAQIPAFTMDQVFGKAPPAYANSDISWVDAKVLSAIKASNSAQLAAAGSAAPASTSSTTVVTTSATTSPVTSSTTTSTASTTTAVETITSSMTTTTTAATTTPSTSSMGVTSSSTTSSITTTATSAITTTTTPPTVVSVALDGSAPYSDINAAVSYAQGNAIPSVMVKAGTYGPLTIVGTQTVTVVGPVATSVAENQVVVAGNGAVPALSIGSSSTKGSTFRFMNFTNPGTSGVVSAVSARGLNLGIYNCALIAAGQGVYSASYGITIIADSYIEGPDKLFYNFPTVYIYRSTLVATATGSSIFYAKGASVNSVWYSAAIVVDSSSVVQKPLGPATGVWLAAPNGATGYTTAIYRNTTLGSLIAAGGVHSTTCTVPAAVAGEFLTTGSGAYAANAVARQANCDLSLSPAQVSSYTIDKIFAQAFPPYGNTNTDWIDTSILAAINTGAAAQVARAGQSTSSSSSTVPATISSSTTGELSTSSFSVASTTTSSSTSCSTLTPGATLIVSTNAAACEYSTVASAIAALPNDSQAYTISIKAGTYTEQIAINRNGKVTLVGETSYVNDYTKNTVTIQFSRGVSTSLGQNELTPVLYSKKNDNSGLAIYNINFVNTYPQAPSTAALAADFYGTNMAAYGCSFIGYQDTLLANKGTQVFSNSYIEGSVDYLWGYSTAYFKGCYLASNTKGGYIAAHNRPVGTKSGYVLDSCYVSYTKTYGTTMGATYLGRPWNNLSTVVYMNSYLDAHINPAGWAIWSTSAPQTDAVTFGEYNNTGPGSWKQGTARASFASDLTTEQASTYSLSNWIGDIGFIDQTAWNYKPSFSWNATSTVPTTPSASAGPTTTATVNAHPDSGTVPPQFAVTVSKDAVNGSYPNVTAALASLPGDNTNQTVFIYPGTYVEQVPSINRPGAVRIIGYTTGQPGKDYRDNLVTISFARGLLVNTPGRSNAETAVVSTASNRISFYNINMVNTENLAGLDTGNIALAASVYGTNIAWYACSFNGWQDTLLTGTTTGQQYFESSYIGGAIDFIWGYGMNYFKGCTIGAKRAKSCIAAHSRSSLSAPGGYVFDQCLFTKAPDSTVDLAGAVYLARPYSQYSRVIVKNSYLDSTIQPSGWKVWSDADPRTAYITFAEYNNSGPSNWENNAAARLAFGNATLLTSDTYSLASVMDSTSWIDMTYWNQITTPQPAVVVPQTPAIVTASGNSTFDGMKPPAGALIVSKTPLSGKRDVVYNTIQAAIDAGSTSSKTNVTIFIYPGVYDEQIIVNKSGTTIFRGYTSDTDDYTQNQVTIQQSKGIDTQGTGSNVDSATVYAAGNYFYAYNLNFRNNNGTQQNIASVGFAVKSSKYAFLHGCQVYGNQDTLYVNGYLFAFKSYIEGNVDFIFGSGSGYFLSSIISPNEDGIAITADKRDTNITQAGLVFDQSSIVPAVGMTGFKSVSLGRPWNNLARVLYVGSYLDSMILAAGWTQWTKTTPRTEFVTFAEYRNTGPGSSICQRASFSKQLSDTEVVSYQLANFFPTLAFLDFSVIDVHPFTAGIGSAPAACATTSSTSTTVPSSTTSTVSASVTVFTTRTVTERLTATTTLTNSDVTVTALSVVTENHGTTVTPAPVLRTSTLKSTTTETITSIQAARTTTIGTTTTITSATTVTGKSSSTTLEMTERQVVTIAGKAVTQRTTETVTDTVTSTPKAVTSTETQVLVQTTTTRGRDSTIQTTSTNWRTINAAPSTVTVRTTSTTSITRTVVSAATTISTNLGGTVTEVRTATQKAITSSTVLTLAQSTATITTTLKVSTVTVPITSVRTASKAITVTAACTTPVVGMFRRGLQARAAGTFTSTVSATITTFAKTSTITQRGITFSTVVTTTSSVFPTTTLRAATSTETITSLATRVSTVVETGALATVTSVRQVSSVITVSVAGTTNTITRTTTSIATETLAGATITNVAFRTIAVTITDPASTVLRTATSTSLVTESVPGSTVVSTRVESATMTIAAAPITTTSSRIDSVTTTFTAARLTVTAVRSSDVTVLTTTTLPAPTLTVVRTSSIKATTLTVRVTPAPATKTATIKQTTTITATVTRPASRC